ncbi:MAG: glycosyltransferase [Sulfuricurvum sp.]|uniref:glycosyltransferase n=1 Tax=Sulfuricurvum sp. TaxID=2025608 RepID=UPI0026181C27|nr:glycosyltransferase [Sulfuricurvum sp.]MDD2367671.1 glycosyltransferase [Sulfuricurvum sp.]MDD2950008.1 glycosyltransferase [Sulfuricurvum sp.]MDD5118596.1 glycosyltransferase [Sulfuricurvum sp.]
MKQNTKHLLLIGPMTNIQEPSKTGGAVVLFENLLQYCKEHGISFNVIDTNKFNYFNRFTAYISIFIQLLRYLPSTSHVSFHSSRNYIILSIPILLFSKILNKPTSLRKFGGEAANVYNDAGFFKKALLKFIFSNFDTLFMEMKFLVSFFKEINPNTYWFPNVRKRPELKPIEKNYSKRFVFISHVKHAKGVDEILEASNRLGEEYTIDIYGPIVEEKYTPEYFQQFRAAYQQSLPSQQVLPTLNRYDVLLLPTFYKGEGYPGIIIEAFSLGIPVIATTLQGIQEITENYKTGILIEPQNVDQLVSAMEYFATADYDLMSKTALAKFNDFDTDIQTVNFLKQIEVC